MHKALGVMLNFAVMMTLGCPSTNSGPWDQWRQTFKPLDKGTHHFVAYEMHTPETDDARISRLPILPSNLQSHVPEVDFDSARAVARCPIGTGPWHALIAMVGPGEASDHWRYILLPVDSSNGQVGEALTLAKTSGDCGLDILESWLQDLDNNGTMEVVSRTLSYAVPDPEGEYCQEGAKPEYETTLLKFNGGNFKETPPKKIDPKDYPLAAEKAMAEAFRSAGYEYMLPDGLR